MRSLKLVPLFALLASVAGCEMHADWGNMNMPPDVTQPATDVVSTTIDADAKLEVTPGEGVSVFVEYATGGHWHVFTSCDYNTPTNPGEACAFDIYATVVGGGQISLVKAEDLEGPDDGIGLQAGGVLNLYTENRDALSGMTFDTDPGSTVELEVYIDGAQDPHYFYWFGDKVLHEGAPSNPLDLVPNEAVSTPDPGGPGK